MTVITSEETGAQVRLRIVVVPDTRPRRAGRGSGRAARPQARPPRPVRGPDLDSAGPSVAHGCKAERSTVVASWRLTERGIALIIATGLAIATAALVVVGLTAMRVTGDSYAPFGPVQLQR